ncbi:MAG TPA: protein-disulfide reductase DsbD domain-containing protein [Casimicrobiaceae bacterium]|nr:protein-disulfide reductase DsbD domain-containing protein [Casimicrobiaceae bacterium]
MIRSLRSLTVLFVAAGLSAATAAAAVKTQHVEAELVSERTALVPGQTTTVALRLKMEDGWHTYWQNPGDSGLPTTLAWTLPQGVTAGPIQWPAPRALPAGPLVNYGYEGEVLLLTDVQVPANAPVGEMLPLKAKAEWLVCRETCIPEDAALELELPVAASAHPYPQWGAAIAATRDALPRALPGWLAAARGDGEKVVVTLTGPAGAAAPADVHFFPYQDGRIEPSGKQTFARESNGTYAMTLPVANQLTPGFTRVAGVITSKNGFASDGGPVHAITLDTPLTGGVVAGPKPVSAQAPALNVAASPTAAGSGLSLAAALLFALIGGLVLNLMPCVFPVLSLKALSLTKPGHGNRRHLRIEGLCFGAGVLATFLALAGILLAFRAAGEQFGWGFQLQSPAVVTALALLFFVLALNLSGVFEFTLLVPSSAASWSAHNQYANAALSGVLAVVIASPCTAPFMGAALGFALAQPVALTLVVFAALGLGMAIPFMLLTWYPGWRRMLPKPGPWMERLKQFLAFPLYATVAWLVWVLGAQVDNDAVVRLLVTLVVLGFALWAWRAYRGGGAPLFSLAALAGLAGAAFVAWPLFAAPVERDGQAPVQARATSSTLDPWQSFTPARVGELAASQPVFVDFTAAWCVTCQVNKRLVLNDGEVKKAFADRGVALVRADWTRRDPAITQALSALGRQGVPVYVLYRPGKEPLLLPEVLQRQTVLDALATLS